MTMKHRRSTFLSQIRVAVLFVGFIRGWLFGLHEYDFRGVADAFAWVPSLTRAGRSQQHRQKLSFLKLYEQRQQRKPSKQIRTLRQYPDSMVPWQRYRGVMQDQFWHRLYLCRPLPKNHNNNTKATSDMGIDETLNVGRDKSNNVVEMTTIPFESFSSLSSSSLSTSSRHLLQTYANMTNMGKRNLIKKIKAEDKARRTLDPRLHLKPIYVDNHIVVVDKPSGVLCVPGPRRNPSLLELVYSYLVPSTKLEASISSTTTKRGGSISASSDSDNNNNKIENNNHFHNKQMDKMVVHRLDMDTSGVMVFSSPFSENSLSKLHDDFRERRVHKVYQALVHGHLKVLEGEIDLPLERDPHYIPFMQVALATKTTITTTTTTINDTANGTVNSTTAAAAAAAATTTTTTLDKNRKQKFRPKFLDAAPKPSVTTFSVVAFEYLGNNKDQPVTRIDLTPLTGRTHQLRVHCAAIGHAICGDSIYGPGGEGRPNGGIDADLMRECFPHHYSKSDTTTTCQLCLHARQLSLYHPCTGAHMCFESEVPF